MIKPKYYKLPNIWMNRKFEITIKFPFDTTGYKLRMQIRKRADINSTLIFEPTITAVSETASLSTHTISIDPSSAYTSFLRDQKSYFYDLVLTDTLGENETYLYGPVDIVLDTGELPV